MSKKKILCYVLLTAMLVSMFAAGEVSVAAEQQKPAYSNLADARSRKEVRSALLSAGISAKTADAWLKDVVSYNKTIKNTSLVKKGFKKMGKKPPVYNENRISKLWLKKNKLFIGYNCRITAYDLMKDYIKVGNTGKANPSQLFMDQDALKNAPTKKFSGKQRKAFESVFSTVYEECGNACSNLGKGLEKQKDFCFRQDKGNPDQRRFAFQFQQNGK